ncbi:MAG TPA: carboxypeptidase-like regulatory domain-containing protein [Acidobacteriota bacterium]|nr:carboxypeptidase-like regulatory domain-containing protein [Acidobacteriota bacterium]
MRRFSPLLVLCAVGVCLLTPLWAQTSFTRLSGTVKDQTGGVIPGATVTLTRIDTGNEFQTFTNDAGSYTFGTILPGVYEMTIEMEGFRTAVVRDLRLVIQTNHRKDFVMEPGAISEEVTVTASSEVVLQKTDATVGNQMDELRLKKLPNANRSTISYFQLQPGTTPGGAVTGSRTDQQTFQLDGIDVSDYTVGDIETVIPTPVESVQEFRIAVANPDASFGRSAGANMTLVTKRGGNQYHGSAYWYHQNDNLNATDWDNNRRGAPKPELKDNRFGFSIGGPIIRDKTFFFWNYEGRRLPGTNGITRTVPTQTMRQGLLRFPDANGNIQTIDPLDFDPRGLGANPVVLNVFNQLPLPNTSGGDGLNTGGFQTDVGTINDNDYAVLRVDHEFHQNWTLEAKFAADRALNTTSSQVDLLNLRGATEAPRRTRNAHVGLNTNFTPTLTNEFRFGWVKDYTPLQRIRPTSNLPWLGPELNVAVNIGLQQIDEPTDVDTQRARIQTSNSDYFQWVDNQTWVKGNHVFQYGADVRHIRFRHDRDDKVIGSIGLPVAELADGSFVSIPASQRPSFIQSGDVGRYDNFYASLLGIVNSVPYLAVRDGDLQPLPIGSSLEADTTQQYYSFYFLDTWRATPSLSFNYGLYYGWTTPPIEKDGKQTIMTFADDTSTFVTAEDFLTNKNQTSQGGGVFNPDIGFVPINDSGQSAAYDTDYRNFSPRGAIAWNPSFDGGFLGKLFGDRDTVFRGGYSLLWDRTNTVQTVIIPTLGIGFGQTISVNGPTNGAGEPFRAGVDGDIPLASFGPATSPVIPSPIFSEILSFSVDPDITVPYNHVLDFTIQRDLPGDHIMEIGYIGRLGRNLYQSVNLQQVPYLAVDSASGQSFAQAFDAVATELRNGVAPGNVTPQPFFENVLAGLGGTAGLVDSSSSDIIVGDLNSVFLNMDIPLFLDGRQHFNNFQSLDLFMRTSGGRSNYHGMVFSLRKNFSDGLVYDLNYTFSRSLDQNGAIQNSAGEVPNSFNLDAGYGPSAFDLNHIFNVNWVYELPFGTNRAVSSSNSFFNKLMGGWSASGIVSIRSGGPLTFSQGAGVWGGGNVLGNAIGLIPTTDPGQFGNDVNRNATGVNGVGTNSDPNNGGTGLNLFSNPEQVFNSFRRVLISQDTRDGRGALRAPARWDLDLSIAKTTELGTAYDQPITLTFQFDFLNAFNRVLFSNPSLSVNNPAAFGAFTTANSTPRTIQFGLRVDF